jgi:transketolase N-terminal domain/subunit
MTSIDPRLMANAIRFLSMDAIERAGEGHPGTPLGAADIVTALCFPPPEVQCCGPTIYASARDADRVAAFAGPVARLKHDA